MKTWVLALMIAAKVMGQGCGIQPIKPIPPIGCKDMRPICACDSHGLNCAWQWVCVK